MIRHLLRTEPLARPLLLCLAATFAVVFTYNIADPDLWGHVRYGQHMLERGHIFATDPYSYLSHGVPWINHELLCEFTLGFIEPRLGPPWLLAWKCLMGLLLVLAIVWAHRDAEWCATTVVLIGVLLSLTLWPGWTIRPHLFTYVFLSFQGLIMTEHARGNRRALWFVPPLMVAWTNAHGGFVAGLGVFGVHLLFALCEEARRRSSGWGIRSIEMTAAGIAATAAMLINPYGPRLLTWVWDSLTWPRPEISEWWPVPILSLEYLPFKLLVALTLISLALSRRERRWSRVTILLVAALQAFIHRRHTPLFAILAAYWLPEHLNDCVKRFRVWMRSRANLSIIDARTLRLHRTVLGCLTIVLFVVAAIQLRSVRVERAVFPVAAFEFIQERGLEGRMVTEFNWGQYCLYAFWPRILVSVDGRFDTSYSRPVLDVNLDFIMGDHAKWRNRSPETGPFRADRVLDVGNPNLALVDRQRTECVRVIEQRTDWVLLYQDALAQVWGRRSVYDDPASARYMPPAARSISDETQIGWADYPALPGFAEARPRFDRLENEKRGELP